MERSAGRRLTPAMQQFARFKTQHPDCVLFFRMGDFYEMFDDDAVLVHRVLGLTLTQRTEGIPMAGIPYHALDGYLQQLIEQGYRVAVCDQIQDPREAKGVVDRAVTRVLTPGTLVDEALLDESVPNQVGAIDVGADGQAVLALAEISTGRFTLADLPAERVGDELARLRPTELLYAEPSDGTPPPWAEGLTSAIGCALTPRGDWSFRHDDARALLLEHYGVRSLAGLGLADDDHAIGVAGALLRYLYDTQAPDAGSAGGPGGPLTKRLGHLRAPHRERGDRHLLIDATSLRALEIERTMRTGETAGSLLAVLQRCRTPMGKRLLRRWLSFPLRDVAAIEERQDAVAALVRESELSDGLAEDVAGVQDVARIAGRVSMGRATPRDVVALGRSVDRQRAVAERIEGQPAFGGHYARLTELADALAPLAATIGARCVEAPPAHGRDGGIFRDGIDDVLDEARDLERNANNWLAEYQADLIATTSIPSLKVGYNKVFGYYIEVTHRHTGKVPDAFSRKQTLKNAERYITPELKTFEEKVTTARSRAVDRERELFDELCREAAGHAAALAVYADVIAEIDVLLCFADVAVRHRYVRPTLVDTAGIDITQGRHPVLDRLLGERFVPNDCRLGPGEGDDAGVGASPGAGATLALITGPNMAGKSTFIRQVAIITLLAHTGCFVPAERATIGVTDRIFTRIGAADELHTGQSTFMVEMTETANILRHATERSLVVLDEIGRGTSTLDGLALAWAIAETIDDIGCRALFATHYHELTELADRRGGVANLHVSVREWGEEIIFLYRILAGRTDRSYGIHVAKLAGVPAPTLSRAKDVLESLVVHTAAPEEKTPAPSDAQMALFKEYLPHPVVETLLQLDLDTLTPLQAFDALRELRGQAERPA